MKKIVTALLDILILVAMLIPVVGFLALKGTTWLAEKAVDAINFVREKLHLGSEDSPRWIHVTGEWLIKVMD